MAPTPSYWQALRDLAAAWQDSPLLQRYKPKLPQNNYEVGLSGTSHVLQNLQAAGVEIVGSPLFCWEQAHRIKELTSYLPWDSSEVQLFMREARTLTVANQLSLEWLRSRLAGYPLLPDPRLADGSRLTTQEYTSRIRWEREYRRSGIQFAPFPIGLHKLLELSDDAMPPFGDSLVHACQRFALEFSSLEEVVNHNTALGALSAQGRTQLRESAKVLRATLTHDQVTQHAGTMAIARDNFRKEREEEAIASLSGDAADYAERFERVDRLVELTSRVFGQITANVYPSSVPTLTEATDLQLTPSELGPIVAWSDRDSSDPFLQCGELRKLPDALVPEAVLILFVEMTFGQQGLSRQFKAQVLPNSEVL